MTFAAYLPLSLCDYPGKVSSVVFTQGCNFRCPWCHNKHLLPRESGPGARDGASVLAELAARRNRGLVEGLVVTGGEPTLHEDLPDFLGNAKATGLAVKLDTNGSNPETLSLCLQKGLVDFIAMDVKAPWANYEALAGTPVDTEALRASIRLIASSGIPHQFRTTRVEPLLTPDDCAEIERQIPPGSPHVWQNYRP